MKRILIISLLSLSSIFFLGACASAPQPVPTATMTFAPIIIPDTPTPAATCSTVSSEATPAPDILFPPVSDSDFSFGPENAPVTLIEYCDFQSAECLAMANTIGQVMRNSENVRFVFRPFPLLDVTDKAEVSNLAALAADGQGKFWEMYDILFAKHAEWVDLTPSAFKAWAVKEATAAGMDGNQLSAAMDAPETAANMKSRYEAAKQLSIPAVPLVLINGFLQPSYLLDYPNISSAVGLIALGQKQFTTCPPFNVDPAKRYIATLHTEKGDIKISLFPDKAPMAVNSFVFLAKQGWFDGVTFHRVIPGFIAQTGDPSGTGSGNPGYFFNNESNGLSFDKPGVVGMANSGPDTNGSQFFITYAPAKHLDGSYTVFGQVIEGMNVVEQLTPRDASIDPAAPTGDKIISVEIEEK
jgi:cyclophilin family peptidyl-prolyl cis-trans isomerase/protein-disulfide isomerase